MININNYIIVRVSKALCHAINITFPNSSLTLSIINKSVILNS